MSMVERHRRAPLASLPHPAFRVPSIMEMVMDAGTVSLTAVHGEATGRMMEARGFRACYEKVPAFFADCGLKCVALAEGMDVIVPPSLHLGAVIAAGISQKAALDTAMRWVILSLLIYVKMKDRRLILMLCPPSMITTSPEHSTTLHTHDSQALGGDLPRAGLLGAAQVHAQRHPRALPAGGGAALAGEGRQGEGGGGGGDGDAADGVAGAHGHGQAQRGAARHRAAAGLGHRRQGKDRKSDSVSSYI